MDPSEIVKNDFPKSRRGFDPAAVQAHLERVARGFQEATSAPRSVAGNTGQRVERILEVAEREAAEIEAEAQTAAETLRTEAQYDADRTRREAQEEADALLEQARSEAERVVAEATADAARQIEAAERATDRINTEAMRIAEEMASLRSRVLGGPEVAQLAGPASWPMPDPDLHDHDPELDEPSFAHRDDPVPEDGHDDEHEAFAPEIEQPPAPALEPEDGPGETSDRDPDVMVVPADEPEEPEPIEPEAVEEAPALAPVEEPAAVEAGDGPSDGGSLTTEELIEQLKAGSKASNEPEVIAQDEPVRDDPEPEVAAPAEESDPSDLDGSSEADSGAARLVAMKMALDGYSRDEVADHLDSEYGSLSDRDQLLDDVFARAGG